MPFLIILPCILTLTAFVLTRKIIFKVIRDGTVRFEIHFPIFAFTFEKKKTSSKKRRKPSPASYGRVLRAINALLPRVEITLKRLTPPRISEGEERQGFIRSYGYYSLLSALIVYLEENSQKITVYEDAFVTSGDNESFTFDLALKARLFVMLYGFVKIKAALAGK